MTTVKERLFEAFKVDHALLGSGLHELAERLRDADTPGAKIVVEQLARAAGPHIAFEENNFYPALQPFLSASEIDNMREEHARTRRLLEQVLALSPTALQETHLQNKLLEAVEAGQTHVAECGELFGAMGGLSEEEQAQLLSQLEQWQARAPNWLEL